MKHTPFSNSLFLSCYIFMCYKSPKSPLSFTHTLQDARKLKFQVQRFPVIHRHETSPH